jgi:hypothetical protein
MPHKSDYNALMRLFYFLLFSPLLVHAAPHACNHTDIVPGANLNTCTSLIVNSNVDLTGQGGGAIIITNITGNVEINADIILDGANGAPLVGDNNGGQAGPGGVSDGGGMIGNSSQPAGLDPEDGAAGIVDASCSSGGGGGAGVGGNGAIGNACPGESSTAQGGSQFSFPSPLVGGHGGGAGGEKQVSGFFHFGSGGGAGGALHIEASGTITIADGKKIYARGGRGGNSVNISGAGGGGGGGNILLVSSTGITNQGIIDVSGGAGGTTSQGGIGGAGGSGVFRTQVGPSGPTDLTGYQDFSTGLPTTSRSSLKSDISCGTIAKKNENSVLFQMVAGFLLAFAISFSMRQRQSLFGCIRTLFQSRM